MATVVDRVESLLSRVRDLDVNEASVRTFEDDQRGEIYRHVLDSRGRLRHQELVAQMELAPSTIRDQLAAMEDNGDVARVQAGREQIVCLPEMVPDYTR